MRTHTVTVREGEMLGPIDWTHPMVAEAEERHPGVVAAIQAEERERGTHEMTTDGGWPRFGWHRVLDMGMWDGWPYWRPMPSVCLAGVLGAEWHQILFVTGVRPRPAAGEEKP